MKEYEWAPNLIEKYPYRKKKRDLSVSPHMRDHREMAAIYKTRREFSPDTNPAGTLILDFMYIKNMRKEVSAV